MRTLRTNVERLDVDFSLPAPAVRLIAVGGIAALVAMGLFYSRAERTDVAVSPERVVVTQPKTSGLQQEATVYSKPVQSDRIPIPPMIAAAPVDEPSVKPTRIGFGFYFERLRVQGDASEGEYVLVRRACAPPNMPEVCYLPQDLRPSRALARE